MPATLLREPPPSAANQREKTLVLLREAARSGQGVSGDTLRYHFNIRQAPTRIFELKNLYGYRIETVQDPKTRLATYYFRGDPLADWQPPTEHSDSADWFTKKTGRSGRASRLKPCTSGIGIDERAADGSGFRA